MDAFENSEYEYVPEEPEEAAPQEPPEQPYRSAGAGRKESPYANSPYETYQPPRQEYRYHPQTEPPVKPKKEKKPRKPVGKKILAAVLALVLVAGSCMATSAFMSRFLYTCSFHATHFAQSGQVAPQPGHLREQSRWQGCFIQSPSLSSFRTLQRPVSSRLLH